MTREELEKLDDKERRAFKKLQGVQGGKSGWLLAIQLTVEKGNAERFRKMLKELKEALFENPDMMMGLLKPAAFDAVLGLEDRNYAYH